MVATTAPAPTPTPTDANAPRRDRRAVAVRIALAAAVLAGGTLRVWGIATRPLNFDESFTAMAGRLPIGALFGFLRAHDSHPPLDYLLQLPLARAGADPLLFRLPAVACSIGALALFAWWVRERGLVGIAATATMAISSFEVVYGREARMYAVMQLLGVGVAVVADRWLRAPRPRHAVIAGALVFAGAMTHVSMLLLAAGLFALAGVRRDRAAWHWRGAVATGVAAWAVLWGRSFLVQAHGGHSSWIPRTTPVRFVDTIGALVVSRPGTSAAVVAAVVVGAAVARRRDPVLAMLGACCFAVPAVLAGLLGLRAPVLLDRTLTVVAWAPCLAIGFTLDALARRAPALGVVAGAVAAIVLVTSTGPVLTAPGPTPALTELERVARPGDIVAIQPVSKGVELAWTLGVRSDDGAARTLRLAGLPNTVALALTGHAPTGRIWLMQLSPGKVGLAGAHRCARTWRHGPTRMLCIDRPVSEGFPRGSPPTILAMYGRA